MFLKPGTLNALMKKAYKSGAGRIRGCWPDRPKGQAYWKRIQIGA